MNKAYYVRYLPLKENGLGRIVHCAFADDPDWTLEKHRVVYPDVFDDPGFYTLLASLDDRMTVA